MSLTIFLFINRMDDRERKIDAKQKLINNDDYMENKYQRIKLKNRKKNSKFKTKQNNNKKKRKTSNQIKIFAFKTFLFHIRFYTGEKNLIVIIIIIIVIASHQQ